MNDNVQALWQSQNTETFRLTAEEIRRRNQEMEKKERRAIFDMYLAAAVCSIGMVIMTSLKPTLLQIIGLALSIAGLTLLASMVQHSRAAAPSPEAGDAASIDYHRAILERRLEFCRTRLWQRILAVGPGPLLFSIGFALAHPELAPIMYVQIATFILAVISIVPLNRRAVVKLQRKIDELAALRG